QGRSHEILFIQQSRMLNTDSLVTSAPVAWHVPHENIPASRRVNADFPFIKYSINRLLKA
ncbi:TPA: hypothetical protein ACIYL2_004962, partial [Escherichia coli]